MINLPKWRLTSKQPAFYDTESGTAIEMVAKVYGAMQELIDEHNNFVQTITDLLNEFEESSNKNFEEFAVGLRQEFQDFIDTFESMDGSITSDVSALKQAIIDDLKLQNITSVNYDSVSESLTIK